MGSCQHLDRTTKPSKSAGGCFWSWLTCTWCTSMHQTIPCSELQVSYFALSVIYLKSPKCTVWRAADAVPSHRWEATRHI